MIWFGCTSNWLASSESVRSPRTAARATFALNSAEWLRRGRLLISRSCLREHYHALNQAAIPLIPLFRFPEPLLNAWAIARVLIERCIWLGYILSTEKVEEFYEYSALEVKKWAYKAASLGILELESVEDFDEEMEDELGHRLGKPAPQWDRLGVERMCKQAFDKPLSERLYKLYQLASMSTHPGMDDSGEYFMVAQVVDLGPSGGTGDLGPLKEMLEMSTEVFATLIALAETPLIEAATRFFDDERVRAFLMMRHEPSSLDDKLLGGEPS